MKSEETLFAIARYGILSFWNEGEMPPINTSFYDRGASFVTLTISGHLRGCIGSLIAHRKLSDDIKENARAAAFSDHRFSPLSRREYDQLCVEVSLLSKPKPLLFDSVEDLREKIAPGLDGVIYEVYGQQATFLPQVWEQLPDFDDFFQHLSLKAGLGDDPFHYTPKISTYRVEAFKEAE